MSAASHVTAFISIEDPADEYLAVNLRVGDIDTDMSPEDAEKLAGGLMDAAERVRAARGTPH